MATVVGKGKKLTREQKQVIANKLKECKEVGNELMIFGIKLKSAQERVKLFQWLKKLSDLKDDNLLEVGRKHEYMLYLKATLKGDYNVLTRPFNLAPPDNLISLAEVLANKTADINPDIPRTGKLQPILCHKSKDDRSFLMIKKTDDNGILCYMSVTPDAMKQ